MKTLPEMTERVSALREFYLKNAPMIVGEGSAQGLDYRNFGTNRALYVMGWKEGKNLPTIRMRHAYAESYILKHIRPIIQDKELLVGQPDIEWQTMFSEEEYAKYVEAYYNFLPTPRSREGHMAPDYEKLLKVGVRGLLREIRENMDAMDIYAAENYEKYEFYTCCSMELEGLLDLAERYAAHAETLAKESDAIRKKELLEIAGRLRRVPAEPAESFVDAVQSIHFFTFNLSGLYSLGRLDDLLYPYYEKDIASGRLTPELAQEYLDCLGLMFNVNAPTWAAAGYQIGGVDRDGNTVENDVTWLCLNSIPHVHMPDPNIGLCIAKQTSKELIAFASKLLAEGNAHPAIWNSEAVTNSLVKNGISLPDARQFTHSTCVEVTPVGCSGISVTSPYINTLQAFLKAFFDANESDTIETLKERFRQKLQVNFDEAVLQENGWLTENKRNGMRNPTRLSCLVRDCIGRGKAIEQGGALYQALEADFLGMINTVESINVIDKLVFAEKRVTITQLQEVVRNNFADAEALRRYIQECVQHYGNDDDETNHLAEEIATIVCDCCAKRTCINGNPVMPGAFSYNDHVRLGQETMASPDGRTNCLPLADGSNPVQGYNRMGPTATLASVEAYEPTRFVGGIACNLKFSRNTKELEKTIDSVIHAFLSFNVPQMQVTTASTKEMQAAQVNPEQYQDLLVRIGGYSDFFVKLQKSLQDELIARSEA